MITPTATAPAAEVPGIQNWLMLLMATACGLIAANLYYAQPLIGLIGPAIGLDSRSASLIVTLTQMGYCAGLVLLVPLADGLENRRLVITTLVAASVALAAEALAPNEPIFLLAALCVGLASVAVQMLVPMAAHMAPEASRGRVVGKVVSGLLAGIMLARPVSSLIADAWGWRAVFGLSAVLMIVMALVLHNLLPQRRPNNTQTYVSLIRSLWALLRDTPVLRRRAAYQAAAFAAFSLYWTAVPLMLAGPDFNLSQRGIAWFALAGVAGVFAAPVAGWMADKGHTRLGTGVALAMIALAFAGSALGLNGSLIALLIGGIVIDLGVQANLVLGQRAILTLGEHVRSRLNALYLALFFAGGAIGSAVASAAFVHGGWLWVSLIGTGFPVLALILFATERRAGANAQA
jgi:predicted MFS family arabinose efflux permease